ncbi:DoxX family protein [Rhodococcus sp. MEB064]|uniref:DoxX family protein n=1 Tax=Rhodococcus sp. MEB064 TaxID=1587522 RepID=UPI0005ACDB5C|nr:DoxX family protein [Rhodococcus sp. MEB064]KIQ10992.1 membrane protein [Rhodococcus sp. MEB064]
MTTNLTRTTTSAPSRGAVRAGWIISLLVIAFMLFDSIIHLLNLDVVKTSSADLGLPVDMAPKIGIIALIIIVLYAIPRTAPLGAVLLTGYLGGAVITNWRTDQPLVSTVLFAVYVGIFAWLGVWLRDSRVRALLLP